MKMSCRRCNPPRSAIVAAHHNSQPTTGSVLVVCAEHAVIYTRSVRPRHCLQCRTVAMESVLRRKNAVKSRPRLSTIVGTRHRAAPAAVVYRPYAKHRLAVRRKQRRRMPLVHVLCPGRDYDMAVRLAADVDHGEFVGRQAGGKGRCRSNGNYSTSSHAVVPLLPDCQYESGRRLHSQRLGIRRALAVGNRQLQDINTGL